MSAGPQSVEALSSDGDGIRVVFVRQEDRYAHRIEVVRAQRASISLESVEGDHQDDWPASPPLQHLTIEARGDNRRVALLVGAAGKTHWSVAVESDPAQRRLVFDVACRLGESPETLSSSYRLAGDGQATDMEVHAAGNSPATDVTREEGRWIIRPTAGQVTAPGTVRWKYCVSLGDSDGL